TRLSRSAAAPPSAFALPPCILFGALQPRARLDARGLGSSAFARHYTRNHYCLLLLGVLRCFSSPRSPASLRAPTAGCGLSRSGTPRSMALSASRGNFAAVRALQCLPKPRHPLHALHTAVGHTQSPAPARAGGGHISSHAFLPYSPRLPPRPACQRTSCKCAPVENIGIEPMASCLQSRRSSQLS
ncbi:MAG: hypothetical protein RL012_160, partial [Bacteroidota bacterium]